MHLTCFGVSSLRFCLVLVVKNTYHGQFFIRPAIAVPWLSVYVYVTVINGNIYVARTKSPLFYSVNFFSLTAERQEQSENTK